MFRRTNTKSLIITVILLAIVMGYVGYAYLNKTLTINGDTTVAKTNWSVKFTTITQVKNEGEVLTAPTVTSDTSLVFGVRLSLGNEYSFKVKIENQGTIDAMISSTPTITGLENTSSYLESSITYSDGIAIEAKNLLKAGESDEILVRLKFKDDVTATDIASLTENISKTLRLSMTYVQDDGTGVEREYNRPVCIKATTLHTETCSRTSRGCYAVGYYSGGSKGTTTITYGHTTGI